MNPIWEKYFSAGLPFTEIFKSGDMYFSSDPSGAYELFIIKQVKEQAFLYDSIEFWCEEGKYTKVKCFYNIKSEGDRIISMKDLTNSDIKLVIKGLFHKDITTRTNYDKGDTL